MEGEYSTDVYTAGEASSAVWIMTCTGMVFLMQAGFALVESGMVRKKNSSSILVKNLYNVLIGVICYWLVGFGFSLGADTFIGGDEEYFASNGFEKVPANMYLYWNFFFTYAIICSIVAQGALAERT